MAHRRRALGDLCPATDGLTLIEAASPREEAAAIALCLRKAVEDKVNAVLIAPDRVLSRHVTAELDRWGITPDDSAGEPLNQTAPGRLLRQVAALLGTVPRLDRLLALLKHPLTAVAPDQRGAHLGHTRILELKMRRDAVAYRTGHRCARCSKRP